MVLGKLLCYCEDSLHGLGCSLHSVYVGNRNVCGGGGGGGGGGGRVGW